MKSIFLFGLLFVVNFFAPTRNSGLAANGPVPTGQTMTTKFKVFGNCGMCKKRIENAARIDGVETAEWDIDSHILTVTFDEKKVKPGQIQKAVAAVGHDTEKVRADDSVYSKLHECCQYQRAN